jgi:hypothetical protein
MDRDRLAVIWAGPAPAPLTVGLCVRRPTFAEPLSRAVGAYRVLWALARGADSRSSAYLSVALRS